ncbi:unnamed protein product [Discosporangium mesarthrocarpum]
MCCQVLWVPCRGFAFFALVCRSLCEEGAFSSFLCPGVPRNSLEALPPPATPPVLWWTTHWFSVLTQPYMCFFFFFLSCGAQGGQPGEVSKAHRRSPWSPQER